jgi:hypothetical protein
LAGEPGAERRCRTDIRLLATAVSAFVLAALVAVASPRAATVCHSTVQNGVLPVWARAGFSDPKPRLPHVLGARGEIAALVFGFPLLSPPGQDRNNKILWVSRRPQQPMSALKIRAQRMQGSRPVGPVVKRSVIGGPGPSIVDLPAAGCWRLALRWSGRTDTLDLRYETGR